MSNITTEDVRRQIQDGSQSTGAIDGPLFDRWLAEHDQDVAAAAWDQGQTAGLAQNLMNEITPNPYDHRTEAGDGGSTTDDPAPSGSEPTTDPIARF